MPALVAREERCPLCGAAFDAEVTGDAPSSESEGKLFFGKGAARMLAR